MRSYITVEEEKIVSSDELKILGFTFGRRPTVRPHFEATRRKYAARKHSIRHLKKIGIKKEQLVRIYSNMVRPVIEFASQAISVCTQPLPLGGQARETHDLNH